MGCGANTSTSSSQPPQVVQDAYKGLIDRGTAVANQPLQQYSGNLIAGFTPMQMQGFQTIQDSQGIAAPYINAAAQYAAAGATPITPAQFSPGAVQQYESPYTQDVVNATRANIDQSNAEQQQGVIGNAISKGAWGGDRAGIAQAELARQQKLAEDQTLAGLQNQGYAQALGEFNTQQQAGVGAQEASNWLAANAGMQMGALGNEALNTSLSGANAQLGAGALQQSLAQQELNIPYEQFLQQQAYPYQSTNFLAGLTEGAGSGMGGTSSTTSPGTNAVSQLAGLGLAGAAMYAMLRRGGRVRGYDAGGPVAGFSPVDAGVPDVSVNFVPAPVSLRGPGAPPPPKPVSESDPMQGGMSALGLASMVSKLHNPVAGFTGPLSDGVFTSGTIGGGSAAAQGFGNALDEGIPLSAGYLAGGRIGYADGGTPAGPIAGFAMSPGRNIQIPMLATRAGPGAPVDIRPTSYYAPPDPTTLPHVTIPLAANIASPQPFNSDLQALRDQVASLQEQQQFPTIDDSSLGGGQARGGRIVHSAGGIVLPDYATAGFDAGGMVGQAGMTAAGMPVGAGNPMAQGMFQRLAQIPTERLQELAVRVPPTSAQGMLLRRALQMRHMNPMADPSAQQQPVAGLGAPSQAAGQGPMRRGGMVAGFADGGAPDATDMVLDDTGAYVPLPDAHLADEGPHAQGIDVAPLPSPDAGTQPPENRGTDIVPPPGAAPQAGLGAPSPTLTGDQPSALNPAGGVSAPPAAASGSSAPAATPHARDFASNPWMPVLVAGLGMMSSRSPHALSAIGEGGLQGMKALEMQQTAERQQQQADSEAGYRKGELTARQQSLDNEAKRLAEQADYHRQELGIRGKQADLEGERVGLERTRAEQGRYQYLGPSADGGGSVFLDQKSGDTVVRPDVKVGPKSSSGSATQWKYDSWLAAHPGDTQGALDYAGGHRAMSDQDIAKSAYSQAQNELGKLTVPPTDPTGWVNNRAVDIARQIRSGFGATPAAPAPAAPAATPGAPAKAAPAAAKPQAQAAPAYTAQNPWMAPQGADEQAIRDAFGALPPGSIYRNPADGKLYTKK